MNRIQYSSTVFLLSVVFRFATRSQNGLLLFNGRYDGKGDFIALELVNGGLRFSLSLGDPRRVETVHIATGSTSSGLDDGNWHTVELAYHNRVIDSIQIRFRNLL